ncbi:DUF551 domain-containing protein [Frisingicoccus caecimuris]|uniref:Uncharacterized protein DUF551 n=1 Tax=Frisingicoccus caecimuris TaxID=1796636 RepID=A0A4R2LE78_9FIRM|nr:DUF551 domain-containing protein [Frisingicoccus caecimuris]MCR1918760.1 DUF551 domain-containing protein [Frisingicoccus caecimuris]TCO86392.1 uncharacterized protein DUF551 [Frisingicoccus caecimuris]
MERLTSRDSKGNLCLCNKEVYGNNQDIYNAIAVLEDYEDTGITPDQLQVINEEYQKMAKELAELRQQNRWIPVSERLPDYEEEVLITNGKYVTIDERYFLENTEDGEAYTWDINGWDDVVAWMPLPEPYKE